MINHLFRSALTRNTQAFSYLTHVGASRGLLEHNIGQVKNIAPEFQGGVKAFSSSSIIGKMSGVYRGLLERKVGSPFLARWKSTKAEFKNNKPLKQLTFGKGKTGGRNSQGRITSFHRGGGSKRLQRRIDLKRSTSSLGVIERIEYDPNRSSRIALVRWEKGVQLNRQRICKPIDEFALPHKILEPTMTTIESPFSFSSLPGNVDQRKVACFSPAPMEASAVIGLPKIPCSNKGGGSQKCSAKDVFLSTLCSPKAKADSASLPFGSSIPRIAVAGAKPAFFAVRMKEDVGGKNRFSPWEIRRFERQTLGEDRIKRKAAVSWQTFGRQESLGTVGAAEHNKSKLKVDQVSLPANPIGKEPKEGLWEDDRAPVSYIIASKDLKVGQMVMNCDLSKSDL